ncbi:hypothetical protein J2X06_002526 [Lysobacter niastensis]|uniref:Uncharacterized protein n=1 Tax=Lysobacter niastensis TaxID=380629 RepID=A0ABU1WDA0_9GAMM|nr:hypothetical protein [Lysobacter niastensis]MDR7135317.1 hypothetical protein [Lysobacter niastensis]
MNPWLGASKNELVSVWGYPTASIDIVQVNDQIKVYTYRYATSDAMTGAPTTCRISFTLRSDYVERWDLNGGGCPRNERGEQESRTALQQAGEIRQRQSYVEQQRPNPTNNVIYSCPTANGGTEFTEIPGTGCTVVGYTSEK